MYRKQIEEYIDSHCQDMVDDIFTLCRVNSERTAPEEGKPYGCIYRRWCCDCDAF